MSKSSESQSAPPPSQTKSGPPNPSLYVNNLSEKPRRSALKKALYARFSEFGRVLEVRVVKSVTLKGQAWVTFETTPAASSAMRSLQGSQLLDKPMRIQFALEPSDVIAKREGTYVPRYKRSREELEGEKVAKESRNVKPASESAVAANAAAAAVPEPSSEPPNKTLFIQNLPKDTTDESLRPIFSGFPGLADLRIPPGRGVAFAEYVDIPSATSALQNLHNYEIAPGHLIILSYAKK